MKNFISLSFACFTLFGYSQKAIQNKNAGFELVQNQNGPTLGFTRSSGCRYSTGKDLNLRILTETDS